MGAKLLGLVLSASPYHPDIPNWYYDLVNPGIGEFPCVVAAYEARNRALARGITIDRMEWIYGAFLFGEGAHVALVIDGKHVIDNGGLGRNRFGNTICPTNVCYLSEARRAFVLWKRTPANTIIPDKVAPSDWGKRNWH